MFETSVVRAQAVAARGRVGLLTASFIAHSAIIVGAVAVSIASVDFPAIAPDEYSRAPSFVPVRIPPPLGTPDGGAKPQATQPQAPKPAAVPSQVTAPATVPETITPVESSGTGDVASGATGVVPGPIGVPWGVKDSIGDLDAPPIPDVPVQVEPEAKIYQPYEVQAPVLLRKVDPRYPLHLAKTRFTATVVVRCVIDRDGTVRDPQVVVPASMPPFNTAVLDVLPQWRYKPATHNGRAVDSYLDLTVTFSVQR